MSWVYVVLLALAIRDYTIAGSPELIPSSDIAKRRNVGQKLTNTDKLPSSGEQLTNPAQLPSPRRKLVTRASILKPTHKWSRQQFRRTRRMVNTGLFKTRNQVVKRFFEFYPTALDTSNVFSKPLDVTPKRYFHYSPFVRYIKGDRTLDKFTLNDGDSSKEQHIPFVNHFTGVRTWAATPVENSVPDARKLADVSGVPARVTDELKDGDRYNNRLDALSKLLDTSRGILGIDGMKLFQNEKHNLANSYSGSGFDIQRTKGTVAQHHSPESFSNMNQRSDWGKLSVLGVTTKPFRDEIMQLDLGDFLQHKGHQYTGESEATRLDNPYIAESTAEILNSYPSHRIPPVLNSNPSDDSFGAFNGFVSDPIINVFDSHRPSSDVDLFGMFGDIESIDRDVLDDVSSVFSGTKSSSSFGGFKPFASLADAAVDPATNVPPKPHFGFDIPRPEVSAPQNGMHFFGGFSSDSSGCAGIEWRACIVDAECSCYGLYFCVEGSCRSTLPEYTEDDDNPLDVGQWHDVPIEFPDTE